jgi:D-cysteine desulfhydrase
MVPGRLALAQLPTPIEHLPRWSERLGVDVYVKRDDLTGFELSGNKVRKLELLLAEARHRGAEVVLTCGGLQSNHCRATAAACRRLGLHPVLLLRGDPSEEPDSNLLLARLYGSEVHGCTADEYRNERTERLEALADSWRRRGREAFVIPEGGSNGLGAIAYARAAQELVDQGAPRFDHVVVAVGSGGTLAGLALGPDIGPLRGVAVCDDRAWFVERVRSIAEEARELGWGPLPPEGERWEIVEGYQGSGYAIADASVWDTIATVARLEGLLLDPVYTGKAMHALACEARAGRWKGRILFWHTGGGFGLFGRGVEVPA